MNFVKKQISIHSTFIQFLFFAITLPLIILGIAEMLISSNVLNSQLSIADKQYVRVMTNNLEHNINHPVKEVKYLSTLFSIQENDLVNDGIAKSIFEIYDQVISIQVANNDGIITHVYPQDQMQIGIDISGYDYFKNIKNSHSSSVYWSPSFLSAQLEAPAVSVSFLYANGVITAYLALNNINVLPETTAHIEDNLLVTITDQNGVYIKHMDNNKVLLRDNNKSFNKNKELWQGDILTETVIYKGQKYFTYSNFLPELGWMITHYKPTDSIEDPLRVLGILLFIITFMLLLTGIYIGNRISKRISIPIEQLLSTTQVIATGDYSGMVPDFKILELTQLSTSFNIMAESIKRSKDGLKSEVENRTKELRESQKQLILSERMAALGGLVAGVAHEINTPIGIIVTSASYLENTIDDLLNKYNNGELSQTHFNEFCENVTQSSRLILSSSNRASNLIKSFKEVAVDQTSGEKRSFVIGLYTDEVIFSLHHSFKRTEIEILMDCEEVIEVKTFPGAYSQVITNLLTNSLTHGFEIEKKGTISITIRKDNSNVIITYRDSGKGIKKENIDKVFDPFFTTKRNEGGSGLGLNIVYNLVTQKLQGDISCSSLIGKWTEFEIIFPINVKHL